MPNLYEAAGALSAHDAEVFCGKNGIEFHPIVCDIVSKRDNPNDPKAGCGHVNAATREAAEAAFKAAQGAEAHEPAA